MAAKNAKSFVKDVVGKKTDKGTTYYILVIDNSASMAHLKHHVPKMYTQKITDLTKKASEHDQYVLGTVIKFDKTSMFVVKNHELAQISNKLTYEANGDATALFDAVNTAIESLNGIKLKTNDAVLVEIITDGANNAGKISDYQITNKIAQKQDGGQWTFIFQVPIGHKADLVHRHGIPADNVNEWETSIKGLVETCTRTSVGLDSYMSSRAGGQTQSLAYYKDIDVSDLKTKDLKSLDNVTHRFKTLKVDREEQIRPFVERNLNAPMVLGQAYYELTKPELLRTGRDILIVEKNKTTIWGGSKVREILGLPKTGNVKVNPHNLAAYKIYFSSASNNRLLVRGTSVLVDTTKTKPVEPTWEKPL